MDWYYNDFLNLVEFHSVSDHLSLAKYNIINKCHTLTLSNVDLSLDFQTLCNMLMNNKTVIRLDISTNNLTNLDPLSNIISSTAIKQLNVSHNNICSIFNNASVIATTLKYFDISFNPNFGHIKQLLKCINTKHSTLKVVITCGCPWIPIVDVNEMYQLIGGNMTKKVIMLLTMSSFTQFKRLSKHSCMRKFPCELLRILSVFIKPT